MSSQITVESGLSSAIILLISHGLSNRILEYDSDTDTKTFDDLWLFGCLAHLTQLEQCTRINGRQWPDLISLMLHAGTQAQQA